MIRMSWTVGLDLWKSRNKMVHGINGTTSKTDTENTAELVRALYDTLRPTLAEVDRTLFPEELSGLIGQSHQCQSAWIEQMKFLYPERYEEILTMTKERVQIATALRSNAEGQEQSPTAGP